MAIKSLYAPVLSSPYGSVLSHQDLEQIGISYVIYRLNDLLIKPGLTALNSAGASEYIPWKKTWILDTTRLTIKEDQILVHSPYDGSKEYISYPVLSKIIQALNPSYVFNQSSVDGFFLKEEGILLKDADGLMEKAALGYLFLSDLGQWRSIQEDDFREDYTVLSEQCSCEACQLSLTYAYFHHLFEHTPGLCQRYLIQHTLATFNAIMEVENEESSSL